MRGYPAFLIVIGVCMVVGCAPMGAEGRPGGAAGRLGIDGYYSIRASLDCRISRQANFRRRATG